MTATPPLFQLIAQFAVAASAEGQTASRAVSHYDRVFVCRSLAAVDAADWDRLLELDDAPLLSWGYLEALEASGCVGGETSWQPAHLLIRRVAARTPTRRANIDPLEGELVAAAPAYVKFDSDGEWVMDLDWAEFAQSRGCAYYPKLVLAVPFNPVGGSRLLTRPELDEGERGGLRRLLLLSAKRLCQLGQLSSAHVLFPRQPVAAELDDSGFLRRQQEQYHFINRGYGSFEDFLAQLRGHRRNTIRRERRALREAGIRVTTYRGLADSLRPDSATAGQGGAGRPPSFGRQQLDQMFELYVGTSRRYTGELPYLNRRFFHLCAERLGPRLELVLAYRAEGDGESLLGGAWNLRGDRRLFGRYWGQRESEPATGERPIPFLHFEVCFYHSVERCIADKLEVFEPGHGGEQKLLRGFTPILTHSAHYIRELRLRRPLAAFLAYEAPLVLEAQRAALDRCPLPFAESSMSAAATGTGDGVRAMDEPEKAESEDGN